MTPYLLPIYLDQAANGSILPLLDYVSDGEVHPLGAQPGASDAELPYRLDEEELTNLDATLSVGLFGMAGVEGSASFETKSYQWSKFGDKPTTGSRGVGYNVRWGFGYRLHVQSSKQDVQGSANAQALAFKTRLKGLQTSFAAESFGVASYDLYSSLPIPDSYDATTLAGFDRLVRKSLAEAIQKNEAQPIPLGVYFDGDYARLAVGKAMAVRLAANALVKGLAVSAAQEAAVSAGLPDAEVARAFLAWKGDAQIAKMWQGSSIDHRGIEALLPKDTVVAEEPIIGAKSILSLRRLVVRSQLVDIKTSESLGYGPAEADASGEARRLVYEVFTRSGLAKLVVENGVARLDAPVSGMLRINCYQERIDSKLQGSFSGVSASVSEGYGRAKLTIFGVGYSKAVDEALLKGSADAATAPSKLASLPTVFTLLSQKDNHVESPLPANMPLQLGLEQDPRAMPGARALSLALEKLAKGAKLSTTRDVLRKLGYEPAVADAVYAWIGVGGAPTATAEKKAQEWLSKSNI